MLIRAKLHRPRTPKLVVERPHLLERLDAALDHPLAVVSAGPGFGKTTLAAQWLEQRPVRASWLSLDPLDEDRDRFSCCRYWWPTAIRGLSIMILPDWRNCSRRPNR